MWFMQDESSIAAHLGERAARTADTESVAPDNGDNAESVADEDVPDQTGLDSFSWLFTSRAEWCCADVLDIDDIAELICKMWSMLDSFHQFVPPMMMPFVHVKGLLSMSCLACAVYHRS